MPRLLFEKTGNAVWISHLDLMRLFQRAFKRAGLPLTHTQGFNPRPSVSIALPLSVGVESRCELLDFDLNGVSVSNEEILHRLNQSMVEGIRFLDVYDDGAKIKHLAYLRCTLTLEYDNGISESDVQQLRQLFARPEVLVEKKTKSSGIVEQNIIPMIRNLTISLQDANTITMDALICCQNPTLNPMQMNAAIENYLPELKPNFTKCSRIEIYDNTETIFR